MKKSALDFMENRRIKRILSVLLFGICIAYVIVSSISIYDWYYAYEDISSASFMYYIKYDGVPQPPITLGEFLAVVFRVFLKCTGAFVYWNGLYLWAWSGFRNGEQKSDIAIYALLGTLAFYVSWIWSAPTIAYHLCLLVFVYSAYKLLLTFKSDDYMPKTKPILGMLISAGIWIMLKFHLFR